MASALEHANVIPNLRPAAKKRGLRSREMDFHVSAQAAPLPEYKPMFDEHLQHLWVNPRIQKSLKSAGFLDEQGKPFDVDSHRRQLYVLEQELAQADALERQRVLDRERKMNDRWIQAKRQEIQDRHLRQVNQLRAERRQRRELSGHSISGSLGGSRSLPPAVAAPAQGLTPSRSSSSLGAAGSEVVKAEAHSNMNAVISNPKLPSNSGGSDGADVPPNLGGNGNCQPDT